MRLQIVQLEAFDDVHAIRDRLQFIRADRVVLVLPAGKDARRVIRRKLDLVLIQREAARTGALLALVTTNPQITALAEERDISIFPSVEAAQAESNWRTPRRVFTDRADMPADRMHPSALYNAASRLRPVTPGQRRAQVIGRITALVLVAAVVLGMLVAVVPSARVTINPARQRIDTNLRITASTATAELDVERRIIPALSREREVEATASITVTGRVDVPSSLASGRALFTNRTNNDVTIPEGTVIFSTGDEPARFQVSDTVIVPAGVGSTATVVVAALPESAGVRGNIEPNLIINIEGLLGDYLYVRNPDSTRGGAERSQGVVTRADYDSVLAVARQELLRIAQAQFAADLNADQILVPGSIQLAAGATEETAYSAFVDDQEENLTLNIRARMRAILIDGQPLRALALSELSASLPAGRSLDLTTVSYQIAEVRPPDATGQIAILASASADATARIDAERVRSRIAGLSATEALERLDRDWLLDPVRPPRIDIQPALFARLPFLPIRIQVDVQ